MNLNNAGIRFALLFTFSQARYSLALPLTTWIAFDFPQPGPTEDPVKVHFASPAAVAYTSTSPDVSTATKLA